MRWSEQPTTLHHRRSTWVRPRRSHTVSTAAVPHSSSTRTSQGHTADEHTCMGGRRWPRPPWPRPPHQLTSPHPALDPGRGGHPGPHALGPRPDEVATGAPGRGRVVRSTAATAPLAMAPHRAGEPQQAPDLGRPDHLQHEPRPQRAVNASAPSRVHRRPSWPPSRSSSEVPPTAARTPAATGAWIWLDKALWRHGQSHHGAHRAQI